MKHNVAAFNNENDHYSAKHLIFYGDKFEYWNDIIESFFFGYDANLWDMVIDGYTQPLDTNDFNMERSNMNVQKIKDNKNHTGKEPSC